MAVNSKSFLQPLDRVAIALMLVLSLLIGLLLSQGNAVAPRVRDFSWQDKQVRAGDKSFSLTFSRPIDTKSVEANLEIDPPLPGKFSWAGRQMAYTLLAPAPYGTQYQVQLRFAQERFTKQGNSNKLIEPFTGNFRSGDRALVYLGVAQEEQGRLILYNLTQQQKNILTPKDLVVVDFKPYPNGDKILFSATARTSERQGLISSQLYTVTTGVQHANQVAKSTDNFLPWQVEKKSEPSGKIDLILDNKDYQNLKFDLSADGQTIVVQRVKQRNPGEFGLWIIHPNQQPQLMQTQPGGEFIIRPDSASLAVAQGQGVAILPLGPIATKPLEFRPEFGMVLGFARDNSKSAMVKFNSDYTRSLVLVPYQGTEKEQELLRTNGSILSCQFSPLSTSLYCLLTRLLEGEAYEEQPYVAVIDLKTAQVTEIMKLPNQRDVQMSLSPDGLALLFDQVVTETNSSNNSQSNVPLTSEGQAIATSNLWLLPLLPTTSALETPGQIQLEKLPLVGFHPLWLP